jgi:hypothetical protein
VGPLFVEGMPEGMEAPLLSAAGRRGGPSRLGLQVAVHALVAPVLMRAGGLDELGANAELEPPDAELGEAAEGTGGKGLAIIGADALGEPVGPDSGSRRPGP